ncbi:hypothetical protein HK405_008991 [Cladochytrium tenue]|nr:hypothetical protein HK405_008991 [Cladochytrium tenue]
MLSFLAGTSWDELASSSSGDVAIGESRQEATPSIQQADFGQQANPDGAGDSGINLTRELAVQIPGTQSLGSHSAQRANTNTRPAPAGGTFTKLGRCRKNIKRLDNMRAHIQTPQPARPRIQCRLCTKFFTRPADKGRHERCVHAVVPAVFLCHGCGAMLNRKDSLLRHIRGCAEATAAATLPESSVMIGDPGVAASAAATATIAMAAMTAAGVATTTGSTTTITTIGTGVIDEPAPPVRDAAHFSTYEH